MDKAPVELHAIAEKCTRVRMRLSYAWCGLPVHGDFGTLLVRCGRHGDDANRRAICNGVNTSVVRLCGLSKFAEGWFERQESSSKAAEVRRLYGACARMPHRGFASPVAASR